MEEVLKSRTELHLGTQYPIQLIDTYTTMQMQNSTFKARVKCPLDLWLKVVSALNLNVDQRLLLLANLSTWLDSHVQCSYGYIFCWRLNRSDHKSQSKWSHKSLLLNFKYFVCFEDIIGLNQLLFLFVENNSNLTCGLIWHCEYGFRSQSDR